MRSACQCQLLAILISGSEDSWIRAKNQYWQGPALVFGLLPPGPAGVWRAHELYDSEYPVTRYGWPAVRLSLATAFSARRLLDAQRASKNSTKYEPS